MASDPRNERRGNRPVEVRADDNLKARLQAGAHNIGSDLSKVTKQLWAWWLGDTDELPERPRGEP